MTKKISIIIPAYNAEKYIERTLSSIVNQSYNNLEIIVIDDGSTDNTLSLCNEYSKKDNRIMVIHKNNEGVSKARDLGIISSTGDYIGFVDSDDTIEPNMYELLLSNLIRYDADISHCGHKCIKSDGNVTLFYGTNTIKVQDNYEGIIDLITGKMIEPGIWSKLYKREIISDLVYDKEMRINEDYVINLLAFSKAQKSVYYDVPLYNYFQNTNSSSRKKTKEYYYRDILSAADLTLDLFQNNELIFPYAERRWFKTYSDMYKNQWYIKPSAMEFDREALLKKVLSKIRDNYKKLKNNCYLNKSDKFILLMLKYSPKLLISICKFKDKI